jgi:manganese/zinc-transporting P-type ATPase C
LVLSKSPTPGTSGRMNQQTLPRYPHLTVCHTIPGRVRVKVFQIKGSEPGAQALQYWLADQSGVQEARASAVNGSVVLRYDAGIWSVNSLLALLDQALSDFDKILEAAPPACTVCQFVPEPPNPGHLWAGLAKVFGITGFLAFNLLSSWIFGFSFNPLVISAAATLASWPLLNRASVDILQGRVFGLNPLLGTGALLAILTGEPLTALEVVWIIELGRLLEDYIIYRTHRSVLAILQGTVKPVHVLRDGVVLDLPPDQVELGDLVQVHATERIPVDGRIAGGEALVDLSHLSGHNQGDLHQEGQQVWAGTLVQTGNLEIKAEKVGAHTYFARMLALVKESLDQRSPGQEKAEVLAERLSYLGTAATVTTFLITADPSRVFAVMLVMACPCATVLAATTAVTAALANAADNLILIKGGACLERFGETDCLCLDKTGTLTSDTPQVVEVISPSASQSQEVLFLAAAAEQHNPHPAARAILQAALAKGYQPESGWVSELISGQGVRASRDGKVVLVGNRHLMEQEGLEPGEYRQAAQTWEEAGEMPVFVAWDGEVMGLIRVAHPLRPNVPQIFQELRADGITEFHLLSGDVDRAVRPLATRLGCESYRAAISPLEKAEYVEALTASHRRVAVVGDGVNDALALSKAPVGVAMGAGGAEAALVAADITLVDNDLHKMLFIRQLSRRTRQVIEQNYWLAVSTDLLGALLAVLGRLTPVRASAIGLGHAAGIFLNSSRLLR